MKPVRESIKKALREDVEDSGLVYVMEDVNLDLVEEQIGKMLGERVQLYTDFKKGIGVQYVNMVSDELVSKVGIFGAVVKSFQVEAIGMQADNKPSDVWFEVNVRWKSKRGGNNKLQLCRMIYDTTEGTLTIDR